MAFRSASTNATAADPLTITAPAGIQDGDILVAVMSMDQTDAVITPPAGFAEITGSPQTATAPDQAAQQVFVKKAASESGDYVFDSNGAGGRAPAGTMLCFSGEHATNWLHKTSGTDNEGTNASPWTITSLAFAAAFVTTGVCDIIWIATSNPNGGGAVTTTPPSGYTPRGTDITTIQRALCVATKDAVAAGFDGVLAGSASSTGSAGWAAFCIALLNTSAAATDVDVQQLPRGARRGLGRGLVSSMSKLNGLWRPAPKVWAPGGLVLA